MKNNKSVQKLVITALFAALAVVLSSFSIPMGVARVYPIQHAVNVMLGVLLGPTYAIGGAFITSTLRVMMGTGTLLAYPGSMVGAWLCGMVYKKYKHLGIACLGEIIGTGVLGALLAYPVAAFILGRDAALFGFIVPFSTSAAAGGLLSSILLVMFKKMGVLEQMKSKLQGESL